MASYLQLILATSLLSAGVVTHAGAAPVSLTDAQVLVQSHATAALQSRFTRQEYMPDCAAAPKLCQAPMMCQEPLLDPTKPLAIGGQPNYHSWCGLPHEKAAAECAAGNFSGYATLMHEAQLKVGTGVMLQGHNLGNGIESISAHYCFSYGHCDNALVDPSTTTDDMVELCDQAFGRESWEKMSPPDVATIMQPKDMGGAVEFDPGFKNPHLTREAMLKMAKMSCAQGIYHCDTFYCKREFCDVQRWKRRFEHLRP